MPGNDPIGIATAIVAILTLPLGLLTGLFVSLQMAMVVFVVGWLVLVPLIPIIGKELLEIGESSDEEVGPLERLQQRYIEGEITEEEFDRRVGQLLESQEAGLSEFDDHPNEYEVERVADADFE